MKKTLNEIKPFISVCIILSTLFTVVFIRMENRRMGYALFDLAQKEKQETQKQRLAVLNLARMTSPERVRKIATSQLTFQMAKEGQVIRIAGHGSAVVK